MFASNRRSLNALWFIFKAIHMDDLNIENLNLNSVRISQFCDFATLAVKVFPQWIAIHATLQLGECLCQFFALCTALCTNSSASCRFSLQSTLSIQQGYSSRCSAETITMLLAFSSTLRKSRLSTSASSAISIPANKSFRSLLLAFLRELSRFAQESSHSVDVFQFKM